MEKVKAEIGGIDIVLDDGGHTYEQQIITTENLIDEMNDGGIIVVEDTHTSYMNGYGPKKFTFMKYVRNLIDKINYRSSFIKTLSQDEKRIWSIEIIESMVAFKINRSASNEPSSLVENGGIDYLANDFRYNDNKALSSITHLEENTVSGRFHLQDLFLEVTKLFLTENSKLNPIFKIVFNDFEVLLLNSILCVCLK